MSGLVLPPLLMVSEPGSWAEHTIKVRLPRIVDDVLERNLYPPDIVASLEVLQNEIATGKPAALCEETPDAPFWRQALAPWAGRPWRELSWFFAETYFYRRLLEAVRYFQPGSWCGIDPFEPQKREELARSLDTIAAFSESFPKDKAIGEQFGLWLQRALWGNRADLSNLITMTHAHRQRPAQEKENLLIDHTAQVWALLSAGRIRTLDLVTDNGGLELLSDLGLIDWLLARDLVGQVRLHMKQQPYFVSDAMVKDLEMTIDALRRAPYAMLGALGYRLEAAVAGGRLVCRDHLFWTTCLGFRAFPADLRHELEQADLMILKGDVNYRRLLDDRHWAPTTDLATITRYMPTSFLALRTLKGELIVGLQPGQAEALARLDPQWLLNGERGLVHFVPLSGEKIIKTN